jgi:hypothetical protein
MPLAADAYAEIAPPMLTCVRKNDGSSFELMVTVCREEQELTKIRIGPYRFKPAHQPKPILGGIVTIGGPEYAFFMHQSAPAGWSRIRWEWDGEGDERGCFLAWEGRLAPGSTGVFRFLSMYAPGGLRAGMILFRGKDEAHYGVSGPNYERFESHHTH